MHVLKNKSGATIIFIVIMLVLLFPLIMSSVIDLGNIYFISEQMKNSLNAATKSASTLVDWDRVPHGYLEIDTTRAESAFVDVLASNMGIALITAHEGYREGQSVQGEGIIRFHVAIYNNRHTGSLIPFPNLGDIPEAVTADPIQVNVDRPTVFAVATVDYRLTPLFGGRTIRLTRHASSQLNQREGVAALPPPQTIPIAMITISPTSNILPTTNITFSDSLSTGTITAREWQLNSNAIVTSPPNGMLPAGSHTIRLRVQDSSGLWSEWASRAFEVQSIPVAVLTMTPNTNLDTATNIAFTHNTTSGGQTITAAEWQRNSDAITTTPPNGTFSAGNHVVRLRVRNASGVWSEWVSQNFSVTTAGLLFFNDPTTLIDPAAWTIFNAASTDGQGIVVGSTASQQHNILSTSSNFPMPIAGETLDIRFRAMLSRTTLSYHFFSFGDIAFYHRWEDQAPTYVIAHPGWHTSSTSLGVDFSGAWHEYHMEITSAQVRFFVNGVLRATLSHAQTGNHQFSVHAFDQNRLSRLDWLRIERR